MAMRFTSRAISISIMLITLALCALFTARGATIYAAMKLAPLDIHGVRSRSDDGAAQRAPGTDPPNVLAILQRNAFDWTTGPLPKPIEPLLVIKDTDPPAPDPSQPPPRCNQAVKLFASVYSDRSPEWSFGSLGDGTSPPLLYREGGKVADHEVACILPSAVYMRKSDGNLCSLTMFGGAHEQASLTATTVTTAEPAPSADPELDAAIKKVSDTQFSVQRSFVDTLLSDPAALMRLARVVPHEEDGKPMGVKVYGIRRAGPLGKLGLQNGDLLRNINGMSMADPNAALEAFAKLRGTSDLKVAITRRGQDTSLSYGITD
jgi:general secretion pathway protein C